MCEFVWASSHLTTSSIRVRVCVCVCVFVSVCVCVFVHVHVSMWRVPICREFVRLGGGGRFKRATACLAKISDAGITEVCCKVREASADRLCNLILSHVCRRIHCVICPPCRHGLWDATSQKMRPAYLTSTTNIRGSLSAIIVTIVAESWR